MSAPESSARAIQWLQDLVGELSGLRNATSRDPSFKHWRQNSLTMLQRIWPADQDHAERFRRIPFSPVDTRADVRAQRESFSRGCQEAARVLNGFIQEIRTHGVPQAPVDDAQVTEESGFEDGFPTVDLPTGDLGDGDGVEDPGLTGLPVHGSDPSFAPPPALRVDVSTGAPASSAYPASTPTESRPKSKGLGVAAKLRDLLGLTGLAPKPTPPSNDRSVGDPSVPAPRIPRALDIIPVGDDVDSRPRTSMRPTLKPATNTTAATGSQPSTAATGTGAAGPASESSPRAAGAGTPPAEAGMSVVMSRPTTLRTSIEKVSIESLISPEFRGGAESSGAPPAAGAAPGAEVQRRPPLSIVPPLASDPEFSADPGPPSPPAKASPGEAQAPVARPGGGSKVVPLPLPPTARAAEPPAEATTPDALDEPSTSNVDREALTRATEDFMRSSPVLGATGRKVQRMPHEPAEHEFTDPDAIAIVTMVDELTLLGVPATRQSETRARLLNLARRVEDADLEWNAIRKAVWFAMEYPEVARRLMPLLLPWIDRAS